MDWEQKNPLSLSADLLHERLSWALRSALAHGYSSEQLWFRYFKYMMGSGIPEACEAATMSLLTRGMSYLYLR